MSMQLEFTPHSWYKNFAIKCNRDSVYMGGGRYYDGPGAAWEAYTDDGNTYRIIELEGATLSEIRFKITKYREAEAKHTAEVYSRLK